MAFFPSITDWIISFVHSRIVGLACEDGVQWKAAGRGALGRHRLHNPVVAVRVPSGCCQAVLLLQGPPAPVDPAEGRTEVQEGDRVTRSWRWRAAPEAQAALHGRRHRPACLSPSGGKELPRLPDRVHEGSTHRMFSLVLSIGAGGCREPANCQSPAVCCPGRATCSVGMARLRENNKSCQYEPCNHNCADGEPVGTFAF